jgi:hypothetical protein
MADEVMDGAPVNILHHQEVDIAGPVDVVAANDVGMVNTSDGSRFALEPFDVGGVIGTKRQYFNGDPPPHHHVFAQEDESHAAGAKRAQDFVFVIEDEIPPAPHEELLGLESGQEAMADHGLRHALRRARRAIRLQARQKSEKLPGIDELALADQGEKFVHG